jgi:hypothetical protein
MTLGDSGDFGDFVPRFPIYIPCRTVDGVPEFLHIGMNDSSGHEAAPCIPLFTDKQRCLIFGASCGFGKCVVMENAQSLADFLMERKQSGAGTVSLDPLIPDEVRGGPAIEHAIQFLWRLADPEEA